jgi:hypothetical protein
VFNNCGTAAIANSSKLVKRACRHIDRPCSRYDAVSSSELFPCRDDNRRNVVADHIVERPGHVDIDRWQAIQ